MVSSSTVPAARPAANPWLASLYAGLITAVIAVLINFLVQANTGFIWVASIMLLGIGPVLGYEIATGRLVEWKSLLGGFLGALPAVGLILWPILVGWLTPGQRIGRLFLFQLLGLAMATGVWLLIATVMGQNPYVWFGLAAVVASAVWGGTVAAGMASTQSAPDA